MHNKEKQPIIKPEKKKGLENESTHVRELLDAMNQDPLLQHEMLLNFFRYKQNKETLLSQEPVKLQEKL